MINNKVTSAPVLENPGYCPTCQKEVMFVAKHPWLRDHYLCSNCSSLPRERALMQTIKAYFPNWESLIVHESSPCNRGASRLLSEKCHNYIPSQFFQKVESGTIVDSFRCENLESLSFDDESIDLHISQDVLEHVFHPEKVFSEIARTLKPGGAHIFTVPIVKKYSPSRVRARLDDSGNIIHMEPPVYHGNPISNEGSLVTIDWGFDICHHIFESSGLFSQIIYIDDISKGIRADLIEVVVSFKFDVA